jgi:hypothetical protein
MSATEGPVTVKSPSPVAESDQHTVLRKTKTRHITQDLFQSSKNGVLPFEGVLAKKKIENRQGILLARFPICIGHGDLIEIWKGKESIERGEKPVQSREILTKIEEIQYCTSQQWLDQAVRRTKKFHFVE